MRSIAAGRGEFVDALVALTRAEIHELDHDHDLHRLLVGSIEENVARLLTILGDGVEPTSAPPAGAMEYARRLGSTPTSLASLLRAYRIGQGRFTAYCLEAAARLDPPVTAAEQIDMVNQISGYLDHVCEHVTIAYTSEHERWLRGQEGLRLQWVRRVLDEGEPLDEARAEHGLGYRLQGAHLAIELWSTEGGQDSDLESAAHVLGDLSGVRGGVLTVRRDEHTLWMWLHATRPPDLTRAALPVGVLAAVGAVGSGRAGFVRSRRQAGDVRELMSRARHRPACAAWPEVAPVAALALDRDDARRFVEDTLGPLAGAERRLEDLRDTLRVYLEQHRSHVLAAAQLHLHRNTVGYRVEQALGLCAVDPATQAFAVLTALHVDRWCPA